MKLLKIFTLFFLLPLQFATANFSYAQTTEVIAPNKNFIADTAYLQDRENLNTLQHDAFLYMWEHSHPSSGMVHEGLFHWEVTPVATGATGFGVAALITAVDRGWVTRDEALHRLMKISLFLRDKTNRKNLHGAFPHWLNGETGETLPFSEMDQGADIVETALLMQGLLMARQYFNGPGSEKELREIITEIWHEIEWDWFTNNEENGLYWHWDIEKGFSHGLKVLGNNECLIAYVLAMASPTHPISKTAYNYWTSGKGYQEKMVYGYEIEASLAGAGPLFLAQYSFIGLNPYLMADEFVKDGYYVRNTKHTLSNRGYSLLTAYKGNKYSEDYWGLTASDTRHGYFASEPKKDKATVAPTAALSSLPYTPHYSLQVLESLLGKHKEKIWGPWGPYDAFSLRYNWYSQSYLGINQLPMVIMAENYRSGLLWNLLMADEDILSGLEKAGIHEPKHETGFPEVVQTLQWNKNHYYKDAYDIRRHPDTGLYQIPFWLEKNQKVLMQIHDSENNILYEQELLAFEGRNSLSFPQFMPKNSDTYTLVMTLDKTLSEEKQFQLPICMH